MSRFAMTDEERYHFDLRGFLVVRNALTPDEISACNASIDQFRDRMIFHEQGSQTRGSGALSAAAGRGELWGLLGLPAPYRDPFRRLLVHPVVVPRLNELCGRRFRLDHGPWLITGRRGTDGQRLHGARDVGPHFTPSERYGEWTDELAPEQRVLLYGPGLHTAGKPLPYIDSDGERVWISEVRRGPVCAAVRRAQRPDERRRNEPERSAT